MNNICSSSEHYFSAALPSSSRQFDVASDAAKQVDCGGAEPVWAEP